MLETARARRRTKLHAEFSVRDASAPEALWKRAGARVRVPRALEFLNWTPRSRSCTSTYQVLRGAGHGLAHGTHSREGGRRRADPARPSRRERSWMIRAAERTNPAVLTHLMGCIKCMQMAPRNCRKCQRVVRPWEMINNQRPPRRGATYEKASHRGNGGSTRTFMNQEMGPSLKVIELRGRDGGGRTWP